MTDNLTQKIKKVSLLGYTGKIKCKQTDEALVITCPSEMPFSSSVVFKID